MKRSAPKNVLIDNVAINRRIAGDHDVHLTREERRRAVRKLHRQGLLDTEIADRLGWLANTAFKTRQRLGLPANGQPGVNRSDLGLPTRNPTHRKAAA